MGGFQAGIFGRISQTYVSIVLLFFCRTPVGCGFFMPLSRDFGVYKAAFRTPCVPTRSWIILPWHRGERVVAMNSRTGTSAEAG